MRFLRLLCTILVALALGLFFGTSGPASAQPACGTVTTDTTLTGDCTGPMIVAASKITIDLNGFAVVNSASDGIRIINQVRVAVENGSVTNHGVTGIFIFGGGRHHLQNLEVTNNANHGIQLAETASNTVVDNTITGNGPCCGGLVMTQASVKNRIEANNVSNNPGAGIAILGSLALKNMIKGNTALGNGGDLFDLNVGCDKNRWKNNTFGTANQGCIQ